MEPVTWTDPKTGAKYEQDQPGEVKITSPDGQVQYTPVEGDNSPPPPGDYTEPVTFRRKDGTVLTQTGPGEVTEHAPLYVEGTKTSDIPVVDLTTKPIISAKAKSVVLQELPQGFKNQTPLKPGQIVFKKQGSKESILLVHLRQTK
jgi:hypothetical protein